VNIEEAKARLEVLSERIRQLRLREAALLSLIAISTKQDKPS